MRFKATKGETLHFRASGSDGAEALAQIRSSNGALRPKARTFRGTRGRRWKNGSPAGRLPWDRAGRRSIVTHRRRRSRRNRAHRAQPENGERMPLRSALHGARADLKALIERSEPGRSSRAEKNASRWSRTTCRLSRLLSRFRGSRRDRPGSTRCNGSGLRGVRRRVFSRTFGRPSRHRNRVGACDRHPDRGCCAAQGHRGGGRPCAVAVSRDRLVAWRGARADRGQRDQPCCDARRVLVAFPAVVGLVIWPSSPSAIVGDREPWRLTFTIRPRCEGRGVTHVRGSRGDEARRDRRSHDPDPARLSRIPAIGRSGCGICDGCASVRTEFLFHNRTPDEEQQYFVYRQIAE